MNRTEKASVVERLNETFANTPHIILASFHGLTVNQANELRRRVRGVGGGYSVIKNRLAKRAAEGTSARALQESFAGPCAIATHDSDPVALAKALSDFAKENPQIELLAGIVDAREVVDAEGVKRLAKLPSLPELRGQLLALMLAPATNLVRVLNAPATQLVRVLDERRMQLAGGEEG